MKKRLHHKIKSLAALAAAFLTAVSLFAVNAEVVFADYPVESDSWTNWPQGPELSGRTACLMDARNNSVLYGKGAMSAEYPASITKIMTAIVVLQHCTDLNAIVTMTETGLQDAYGDSSNIDPSLGEQFTVEQCLQMLLVKSANDIATQLAEYTSGSVAAFAEEMNAVAASLGCKSTHFSNASGLHSADHYTSAYDMCLITNYALQFDKFREIISLLDIYIPPTPYYGERYYPTHVFLIDPGSPYYYEGTLGGKTGFTEEAASTLVCIAQRGDMTLIGAVLGAPGTESNAIDMINLFDYGFTYFSGVDTSRGAFMFTAPGSPEEQAAMAAAQAVFPEDETTPEPTETPVPTETPELTETPEPEPASESAEEAAASSGQSTETSAASSGSSSISESDEQEAATLEEIFAEDSRNLESVRAQKAKNYMGIYIAIIIIIAVIIAVLVMLQLRANKIRSNKKRNKRD